MCYHQGAAFHSGRYARGFNAAQHPGFARWARHFDGWGNAFQSDVPVNLTEKKDWFELQVFAPGLNKDAFQVSIADDVLSVRFQPADTGAAPGQWVHQEYRHQAFERRFQLNGKVDTSAIQARYVDGVLELTLPKNPGSIGQEIKVA